MALAGAWEGPRVRTGLWGSKSEESELLFQSELFYQTLMHSSDEAVVYVDILGLKTCLHSHRSSSTLTRVQHPRSFIPSSLRVLSAMSWIALSFSCLQTQHKTHKTYNFASRPLLFLPSRSSLYQECSITWIYDISTVCVQQMFDQVIYNILYIHPILCRCSL